MKFRSRSVLALAAALALSVPVSASAAGFGGFVGVMDTDTLGDSLVYGGQLEFDFIPCVTLIGRGAWAGDFDPISIAGSSFRAEDIAVVPVEVGLMVRPPALFGVLGIYAGGGAGWYYMPGFDVTAGRRRIAETEDVTDLAGWWVAGGVELGVPSFHVFAEAKWTGAKKKDLEIDFDDRWAPGGHFNPADFDLSGLTGVVGIRVDW